MYCTQVDITKVISELVVIQLTDDDNFGTINTDNLNQAIAAASATIDAHCRKQYTVPLSPVPDEIPDICVDIAVYNLYSRRDLPIPDIRKDRNDAAIRFLEKVAAGKISFDTDTPEASESDNLVTVTNQERIFTRDKMKGY